ncbi:MAG: hypothetical protein Q9M91_07510 [Candidatus Dojkabacteria bacterium]|nr:hypothetical protein [Candidatus Dojkabacteria bacterium]
MLNNYNLGLERESDINISLDIEKNDDGSFYVAGRGDLQLAILLEELRREGYELQVRRPEVIIKVIDGKKHEPVGRSSLLKFQMNILDQ